MSYSLIPVKNQFWNYFKIWVFRFFASTTGNVVILTQGKSLRETITVSLCTFMLTVLHSAYFFVRLVGGKAGDGRCALWRPHPARLLPVGTVLCAATHAGLVACGGVARHVLLRLGLLHHHHGPGEAVVVSIQSSASRQRLLWPAFWRLLSHRTAHHSTKKHDTDRVQSSHGCVKVNQGFLQRNFPQRIPGWGIAEIHARMNTFIVV